MKCVVINLADQTARWEAMAAQLADFPCGVSRFDAIRGIPPADENRTALYSPTCNRRQHHQPLTPGEIGCYASHVAVWRSLLASEAQHLAVFEDDVTLHPELPAVLRAVDGLSPGWGLLKLIGRDQEKVSEVREWIPGHQLVRYRRVPSWCSAYVISRRGAEQMLAAHVPFGRPVDLDMRCWWESGCRVFGVQPYPVSLSPLSQRSSIGDRIGITNLGTKLRRAILRCDYNFKNWRANRRLAAEPFPLRPAAPATRPAAGLAAKPI